MELRTQKSTIGPSMMAYVLLILLMNGLVAGNLVNRQATDNTGKTTVIAPTAPPETSATSGSSVAAETGTGSVSSLSGTSVPDRPVLATPSTATGSEAVSTASTPTSTASNSTASDKPLNEFNDPQGCHINFTAGVEINPFCEPVQGSTLDVNASYKVTWDPTWFDRDSNITVLLVTLNVTIDGPDSALELTPDAESNVSSALGFTYINTTTAMLNGSTNASLTLFALSFIDGQPVQYDGPIFQLLDKTSPGDNSTTGHSEGSTSSKRLGEKVGIPIGLIFFLAVIAVLAFFFFRYRRNKSGYAGNKSLSPTSNGGSTSTRGAGAAGGGHRRQESFHDEPTSGGVELQSRNRGLTGEDNWEWGRDSVGSPTSPTSGNQFRDELARQKTVTGRS